MTWNIFLPYLVVMAGVTYLIRALPLTLVRRQIRNRYVRSFLRYVPYAVEHTQINNGIRNVSHTDANGFAI